LKDKRSEDIYYDAKSFSKPVWVVESDSFISKYQGRLYPEAGFYDENKELNVKALGEYFSEGYREFIQDPDNLKKKNRKLYDFIKNKVGEDGL
jgi:hypothetical protein